MNITTNLLRKALASFLPLAVEPLSMRLGHLALAPVRNGTVARTLLMAVRAETPKELGMATQIVMDHTGDTRHNFDAADTEALSKAEERFKALTSVGFTAAVRTAAGEVTVTRSFDPTAEETLFFPRLVGG
jgi:hypothetical protein